ncbi:hypothetical protein EV368DRAFT_89536 [Lentinula lateritia]|nr:hypothetical protein EV368DRAFT_89536 [Lentinula lateritia]
MTSLSLSWDQPVHTSLSCSALTVYSIALATQTETRKTDSMITLQIELIEAAIDVDNRQITQAWEQGKKLFDDGILTNIRPSTVATPFTMPAQDPNAMDIDATTT